MPEADLVPVTAAALLAAVEALPRRAAGAFLLDTPEGQLGAVLVDQNRVCCAAVTGRGRALRDQLTGSLDADTASGVLRRALRRHTVESLVHFEGTAATVTWMPHHHEEYRPRCSFGAVELLAAVDLALYPAEAEGAEALDTLLPAGAIGLSFVIGDDGEPVVVRERDGDLLGIATIHELGAWAISALEVTRGLSPSAMVRALAAATGRASLAWRTRRRLIHAMVIDDPSILAWTVAELDRCGLPTVVSARLPVAPGGEPDAAHRAD